MDINSEIMLKFGTDKFGGRFCELSDLSLEDLYFIFGKPEKMLLTYNETGKILLFSRSEFLDLIKDRMNYWDIVCADCNAASEVDEIDDGDKDRFLSFIYNEECPVSIPLPSVGNSFVIYSHDESLYARVYLGMSDFEFFCGILKRMVECLGLGVHVCTEDDSFKNLFESAKAGISIDCSGIGVEKGNLRISLDVFDENDPIADWIWTKKIPQYKYYYLKITE